MFKKVTLNLLRTAIVKTKCYNLRLFYFSLYCFLMFGCGKKVDEGANKQEVNRPGLSTQFIKLKAKLFKTGQAIDQEHVFENDSEVAIPESIQVKTGNAGNQTARIYFNLDEENKFSFYCNYMGGASTQSPINPEDIENGKTYTFDSCYTAEGSINYYPGNEPTIYAGNSIMFKIISGDPRFDIEAVSEIEVDFH